MYLTISENYKRAAQKHQKASGHFNKLAKDEQRHLDQE